LCIIYNWIIKILNWSNLQKNQSYEASIILCVNFSIHDCH